MFINLPILTTGITAATTATATTTTTDTNTNTTTPTAMPWLLLY